MAHSGSAEKLHIFLNMENQLVIAAKLAILTDGGDEANHVASLNMNDELLEDVSLNYSVIGILMVPRC